MKTTPEIEVGDKIKLPNEEIDEITLIQEWETDAGTHNWYFVKTPTGEFAARVNYILKYIIKP